MVHLIILVEEQLKSQCYSSGTVWTSKLFDSSLDCRAVLFAKLQWANKGSLITMPVICFCFSSQVDTHGQPGCLGCGCGRSAGNLGVLARWRAQGRQARRRGYGRSVTRLLAGTTLHGKYPVPSPRTHSFPRRPLPSYSNRRKPSQGCKSVTSAVNQIRVANRTEVNEKQCDRTHICCQI